MLQLLDIAIGFATVMLAVSLIIMALTQAISSVLALRGVKLRRGLEELIKQTAPSVETRAKELSEEILKHPLISDTATIFPGRWKWASVIKKEELLPVLNDLLKQPANRSLRLRALPDAEQKALVEWFDSYMTRVSQWFVMNTRWITIALAFVLSFSMHLDSVGVLKQLTEDTETRAKVVAMSSSLLEQTPESVRGVETSYADTLKELVQNNAAKFKDGTTVESLPKVTTRSGATKWIDANTKSPADKNDLMKTYNESVDRKLTEALDKSIDRAKTLEGNLTSAGISLYPSGHTYQDWFALDSSHFWGMVVSVLFLSLGAPFWFNLLKSMTSLKSVVATKDETADKDGGTAVARGPVAKSPAPPDLPPLPEKKAAENPDPGRVVDNSRKETGAQVLGVGPR
jgi:hypothetical protein